MTAQQNPFEVGARTALLTAVAIVLLCPGALVTAVVAAGIWRLGRTPLWRRLLLAAASALLLLVAHHWLVLGWTWRLGGLPFTTAARLRLTPPVVLQSVLAEAALGPTVALLVDIGLALRAHTVIGRIHMSAKEERKRAAALQPGYRPARPVFDAGDVDATIHLGVDQNGDPFAFGIDEIAQHIFLPGATGSGKTTTILRLVTGALVNGYAVVIVDGKAGSLGGDVRRLAERLEVPLARVHPDERDSLGYDVCTGDPADVANKLIGAFPFSGDADIYKQVAMQALPVIVAALRGAHKKVTLDAIANVLTQGGFAQLRRMAPKKYEARLDDLQESARDDLAQAGYAGLRYRLRAISEGKFATILTRRPALDWSEVSSRAGITYIGLPTTAVAEDVELFGRVVVQDLKQLCARRLRALDEGFDVRPLLVVFDEFTALREAPQVRDLLLQSRQALMPTVVAQQYLPMDPEIRAAVLQSGILLCHRVNSDDSEAVANELGTRPVPFLTSQVDFTTGEVQKGSVRPVDQYRIHPNTLRELERGQVVVYARPSGRRAIVRVHKESTV